MVKSLRTKYKCVQMTAAQSQSKAPAAYCACMPVDASHSQLG